jgi:hypothetical protein
MKQYITWNEYEGNAGFPTREQWDDYLDAVTSAVQTAFPEAEIEIIRHPGMSGGARSLTYDGYEVTDYVEDVLHEVIESTWEACILVRQKQENRAKEGRENGRLLY